MQDSEKSAPMSFRPLHYESGGLPFGATTLKPLSTSKEYNSKGIMDTGEANGTSVFSNTLSLGQARPDFRLEKAIPREVKPPLTQVTYGYDTMNKDTTTEPSSGRCTELLNRQANNSKEAEEIMECAQLLSSGFAHPGRHTKEHASTVKTKKKKRSRSPVQYVGVSKKSQHSFEVKIRDKGKTKYIGT